MTASGIMVNISKSIKVECLSLLQKSNIVKIFLWELNKKWAGYIAWLACTSRPSTTLRLLPRLFQISQEDEGILKVVT
jgi:hypothetical protein